MKLIASLSTALCFVFLSYSLSLSAQFAFFEEYGIENSDLALHQVVTTQDGGYLLVCSRSCYFPGGVVIEGCLLNMHLIKTDQNGSVLWKLDVPTQNSFFQNVKAIQHSDQSFSLTISEPISYSCEGIVIGGFGWDQTTSYHISEEGTIMDARVLQESCTLTFEDMTQAGPDDKLILCNSNSEPFGDLYGKIYKLNKENIILWEKSFDENVFEDGSLLRLDGQKYYLFYEEDNLRRMSLLSGEGDILWSVTISENANLFDQRVQWLSDGTILLSYGQFGNLESSVLLNVDQEGNLLWEQELPIADRNYLLETDQSLIFPSTILSENSDNEIILYYISFEGGIIDSQTLARAAWEQAEAVFPSSDGKLGIAGNVLCCEAGAFEPANVFLSVVESLLTSTKPISEKPQLVIAPNPVQNMLRFSWGEGMTKTVFLEIFNQKGQQIYASQMLQHTLSIDVSNWSAGMYYYRLSTKEASWNDKFIKL